MSEVGDKITLTGDAAVEIDELQTGIGHLQEQLGVLCEEYEAKKRIYCDQIAERRLRFHERLRAVGTDVGVVFTEGGEGWSYDPDTLTFTRSQ